ncbi:MAG: hypothetical protein U5K75_01625 [Ahrensia sp.]|nr:hypothetical protein [Ahrensia sp.]
MNIKTQNHIISAAFCFVEIARPTLMEKLRLKDLILGHIDNLNPTDQAAICSALASSPHAPIDLLMRLCELDADICYSLLVGSKAFNDNQLAIILAGEITAEKARIIARNPSLGPLSIRQLRAIGDTKIDRSLDMRQLPQAFHLEKLEVSEYHILEENPRIGALIESLQDDADTIVHTALADALGLGLPSIFALCSDPTSRNLPLALRYLSLSNEKAWQVYMRLTQKIPKDTELHSVFQRVYSSLEMAECIAIIGRWQMDELVAITRERNVANDTHPSMVKKSKQEIA